MSIENHFSKLSKTYAQHRPVHPQELFDFLATLAPGHQLAWDGGTGNGQAAIGLANHFERVIGTDASQAQVKNRIQNPTVEIRIEPAKNISL